MSIARKGLNAARRAIGPADDVALINRKLDAIGAQLAVQQEAVNDLIRRTDASGLGAVRAEFDSIATAQAEGMVYVNRNLRDIRAEVLGIAAAVKASMTKDLREHRP